ncbi:MAG: T9SS type A sorting domain-containing protein [Bacteroidetes bacterium]|nr:T9SS type A sorting domain-containing protein [Bacteroidota bacterium]
MQNIFKFFLLFMTLVFPLSAQFDTHITENITSGFRRYPLYEEVTNASCGPCAQSNPALNSYMETMKDSLTGVTYHAWWPGVSDPMYQHNIQQNRDRIQFMKGNVNATPWLNVDGIIVDVWPFSSSNLSGAYKTRMAVASPLGLEVSQSRISADSIEVKVKAYLLSNLPAGTWKLRLYAVEHPVNFTTAPGTNGEKYFPHVFRKSVPNSSGELFPTSKGIYEFTWRYKFESAWKDTNQYSVAIVQDDITKEVVNTGSSRRPLQFPVGIKEDEAGYLPSTVTLYDNYPNPFNPSTVISYSIPEATDVNLSVYNASGEFIKSLESGHKAAGHYKIGFEATGFSSGVYFVVLNTPVGRSIKKISLLK